LSPANVVTGDAPVHPLIAQHGAPAHELAGLLTKRLPPPQPPENPLLPKVLSSPLSH